MTRRCFIPEPPRDRAVLDGSEAHHLLHVLRVAPGDRIDLFDGRGNAYEATVTRCERASVEVEVGPAIPSTNRAAPEVVLGVALPKGDRQRWLVEKCTELGVALLVPIVTQRTVATTKGAAGKLQRYVIEACKQCGRNTLMHIAEPIAWQRWVEHTANGAPAHRPPQCPDLVSNDSRPEGSDHLFHRPGGWLHRGRTGPGLRPRLATNWPGAQRATYRNRSTSLRSTGPAAADDTRIGPGANAGRCRRSWCS